MRRRDFITVLGGAAATWPLATRAQTGRTYRIGILETVSETLNGANLNALRTGLRRLGYVGRRCFFRLAWKPRMVAWALISPEPIRSSLSLG
jgi:hypothetical protein